MRRKHKPALTRPPDFNKFWKCTVDELSAIPPAVERGTARKVARPVPSCSESLELEHISFSSLGNARIHGYLLSWQNLESRPLVVHGHGYGCQCEVQWSWAAAGLNVFGIDVRGFGKSSSSLPDHSRWGYVLSGIDSPESYVVRGAVCDYVRAMEVATHLCRETVSHSLFHGASFSGGLALMAQAVSQHADFLVLAVPTFGWAEGRVFFVKSGSGAEISNYLDKRPEVAEDVMLVLRYFDPINFAPLVNCPTLVGVGLSDEVVPAKTVYAIVNHLACPHETMEFPVSHTGLPEERLWSQFQARWLKLASHGVPASFGTQ